MTYTTTALYPVPAPVGGLPGFAFDCTCGEHAAYAFRTVAEDFRHKHSQYHERKEAEAAAKRARRSRRS